MLNFAKNIQIGKNYANISPVFRLFLCCLFITINGHIITVNADSSEGSLPTVTVRGFLNFRTTVDGTVIVFTPASGTANEASDVKSNSQSSSAFEIKATPISDSVKATSQLLESNSNAVNSVYPTGLVTVLGGTVVHNGATTVYETKVIGTYIDGKYAQILRSTSSIKANQAISSINTGNSIKIEATKSISMPYLRASEEVASVINNRNNDRINSDIGRQESSNLRGESSIQNTRRVRPVRVIENNNKKESTSSASFGGDSSLDKSKIEPISSRITRRFKIRGDSRVRLNRFKVKAPSLREKEEEEAAKEINSRFQKRLGFSKPNNFSPHRSRGDVDPPHPPPPPPPPPPSPAASELTATRSEGRSNGRRSEEEGREEEGQDLSGPGPRYSPPLLDADLNPALEAFKANDKSNSIVLSASSDIPSYPSALLGEVNGQPAIANDLEISVQETPAIVISRTYSLTEQMSRTTVVPVFDGSLTTNYTVTESFEILKLITAYRTVPSGDELLLQTASAEMNNASYMIDAIEASESNLDSHNNNALGAVNNSPIEPSILGGFIQTVSPDYNLNMKTPFYMPALQSSMAFGSAPSMNIPSLDLNNPLIVGAALRNPAFAAMYLGLQNLQQQNNQPNFETITRPVEVVTTETLYNTKVLSFYDGRSTRARTITEPTAKIAKTITTLATEITPKLNTDLLIQQAQLQRALTGQIMNSVVVNNPIDLNAVNNYNRYNGDYGGNQANFNGYIPAIFNASLSHAFGRGFNPGLPQQFNNNHNNNNHYNSGFNMALNQAFNPKPIVITHTYTTLTSVTTTDTKIYTLKYNALSTKYRTVTSTSVYPTVVTTTSLSTIGQQTAAPFNPFFG